jgi:hypothetical protein
VKGETDSRGINALDVVKGDNSRGISAWEGVKGETDSRSIDALDVVKGETIYRRTTTYLHSYQPSSDNGRENMFHVCSKRIVPLITWRRERDNRDTTETQQRDNRETTERQQRKIRTLNPVKHL